MPNLECGACSGVESVEPVTGFAALVRVGEDQDRIRFHGVDDPIWLPANSLAADHGSIVSGGERWGGVELGDRFGMLPLSQGHAVSEARKRA